MNFVEFSRPILHSFTHFDFLKKKTHFDDYVMLTAVEQGLNNEFFVEQGLNNEFLV